MRISIIGGGNVGSRLAALLAGAGHEVRIGARDGAGSFIAGHQALSVEEAIAWAPLIVLALPYGACAQSLPRLSAALAGKIVVDATNPLQPDWSPLLLGQENSGAESIARWLPGARVVKCFNTVFADVMSAQGLLRDGQTVSAFVASDDAAALELVAELAASAGFAAVPCGPLRNARYLEAIAHLNIQLAVALGGGTDAAFIYHRSAA